MIARVCALLRMKPPAVVNVGLLFSNGNTVPSDGAKGYQTGCLYQHVDGGAETALYVNEGSVTSADFNAIIPPGSMELADLGDVGAVAYAAGTILIADGDSYEEIAIFTDATGASIAVTNVDAGASGTAGTVDVFPSTAAKGKLALTAADSAGDTTTTIVNASQAATRTYTIPDAGGNVEFVMAGAAQSIAGAKTFTTNPIIPAATVAAAGSAISDATVVATGITWATGADGTKGVALPAAVAGLVCIIKNDDTANAILKVWPSNGAADTINALGANNSISMAAKTSALFACLDGTAWFTVPLLPS